MSETNIGVKVVADFDPAMNSTKGLTKAFDDNLTAADAMGKGVDTVSKATARAAAAHNLAKDAIRGQTEAQRNATAAEDAHGKGSAQHVAALKRLAEATTEAKKLTAAATAEVVKQQLAVTELVKAADGKLDPSLKRNVLTLKRLGIETDKSANELHRLDLAAIAAAKGSDKLSKGLSMMQIAGGNLIAGGISRAVTGVGDALSGSVKAAIDFEKSFTGITKVLDDKSAANIEKVDAGVKDLAVSLGVLPGEMAAMTQALAASGLQDDLLGYAEDSAKLGVAFDLTGEQAGHAIASLTASLGLSREEMQTLMGVTNNLDDAMNSSAKQLVTYLEGVAGIGRAASISGETMLALGSAIISTGTAPDAAATGVKNFIATLEAGAAATPAMVDAFTKLGFEAKEVARQMATGNAEEQIKKIAAAIGSLPPEERFATLIDLFGKESIGSVGGLATNVDLLGKAFEVTGNKAAAAGSVQAEFERVSETSAHKIAKLKAGVEVLAIQFGDALLPKINDVVEFLSSPEGQDWGRDAVDKAAKVVVTLADGVGAVVGLFSDFSDAVGGSDKALAAVGVTALALTGPFGVAAAAGAAIGYGMAEAYDWASRKILGDTGKIGAKMRELLNTAADIRHKEHEDEMAGIKAEMDADQKYADQHAANMAKTEELAQRYEAAELARLGKRATEEEKVAAFRKSRQLASAVSGNSRLLGGGTEDERLANFEKYVQDKEPDAPKTKSAKEKKAAAKAAAKASKEHDKEEKSAAKFAEDLYDFDQELASHSAEMAKDIREADLKSQEDAEERRYESALTKLDREKEMVDASLGIGEDAAARHEDLLDRRMAVEEAHARKLLKLAKTDEQREKAKTKIEAIEHDKRIAVLKKQQADEQKVYDKKLKVIAHITDAVGGLGNAMVEGAWKAAEGQKGALMMALGEEMKATSKRFTVKALGEAAQAAIALATYNYPGAAQHGIAAGLATAVAVAAGAAGAGATAIGNSRADKQGDSEEKADARRAAKDPLGTHGLQSDYNRPIDGATDTEKAEPVGRSKVPISYDMDRPAPLAKPERGGDTIQLSLSVGNMIGGGSIKEAGQALASMLEEAKGRGRRYGA